LDNESALKVVLRHDTTRRAIEVAGRVSIADLKGRLGVSRLGVTEVTIREDLRHFESIGHVASAFVTDISGADLLITDAGADASVLSNLEGDGLAIEVVRSNAK